MVDTCSFVQEKGRLEVSVGSLVVNEEVYGVLGELYMDFSVDPVIEISLVFLEEISSNETLYEFSLFSPGTHFT